MKIASISYLQKQLNTLQVLLLLIGCFFSLKPIHAQCLGLSMQATNQPLNCLTSLTSATAIINNGTPPYTYTWLPTGGNASVAVNLGPGTYTILGKDVTGCTGSTQLIIINSTGITVQMNPIPFMLNCNGDSNAQIIANVINATPPLSYSWTPAAPNSATITNLSAGIYSVTVTDGIGCKHTAATTIAEPPPTTLSINSAASGCTLISTNATVSASGGTPPFTYTWMPSSVTNSVYNNIPAGNYTVTSKDANGCLNSLTTSINPPAPLQNSFTLGHVSCSSFSNGVAVSNVTGGSPAYSYTWLPMNTNASSTSGLTAGNYTLIVKDVKNCSITQTFAITQPPPISLSISHTDEFCINADGSATVTVNGGTAPYSYTWTTSPVQSSSVATNLSTGNYTVLVKDSKGCTGQGFVTIGNISNMTASFTNVSNVTCNGTCNGSVTAAITGGTGPYTYSWTGVSNGTTQAVSGLCSGTYSVKISDSGGCYTTGTVNITEPSALSYSVSGINSICSGSNTILSASVTGGSPGYTYNWQPGNLNTASVTVNPIVTTAYTLTVSDSKGCAGTPKTYSVIVSAPLTLNTGATSLTVCPNVNTSITVNANGGDGNYQYLWLPGNITTNTLSVNLSGSNVYTITIKDGCGSTPVSSTVSVNVFPIANPNFTVNNTSGCEPYCVQFNNLTTGTTTALWTFGDFSPPVQGPSVTHCYQKGGVYSVMLTVTNQFGCKSSVIKNNYITVYDRPLADFVQKPEEITLNNNDALFENASLNATGFIWSIDSVFITSQKDLQYTFTQEGCYQIQLIAGNGNACRDTATRLVCVTSGFNFWMPKAFSPDEDGINDFLLPQGTGWVTDGYTFEIISRWGMSVFKTNDVNAAWDGKMGGAPVTDDIYTWRVFVKDIYDKEHEYMGHILIMR